MRRDAFWMLLVGTILLAACAPAAAPKSAADPSQRTDQARPAAAKSLTIALQNEPKALWTIMGGEVGGSPAAQMMLAVHQQLAMYDERGQPFAMLAAEIPSPAKGTWIVRPDGSMQTTHKLRPGIRWHDGTPLTAEDFVFALAVTMSPDLPIASRAVAAHISQIQAPDPATVVIDWSDTYPLADVIAQPDLGPLPAHLLRSTFDTDKELFQRIPYWGREFVGVGPYRLADWELGSHLVLRAYDGFFGSRPKIETITFRFIPDESTAITNFLSRTVDGGFRSLDFNKVMFVKDEWERAGQRPLIIVQPTYWRQMDIQYRPELSKLPELMDVRVRRALLMAIDRKSISDAVYFGMAPVADTFIPSDDVKWDWVKEGVTSYPFDSRRALQEMAVVGWRRGGDGSVVNAAGERVTIPLQTTQGGQWESEIDIVAGNWRDIGFAVDQYVIPGPQSRDRELRAKFPGFSNTPIPFDFIRQVTGFYSPECPSERTRWTGENRGCYQNPTLDGTAAGLLSTIEPDRQRILWRDLVKLHGEELPALPLYFYVQGIIFREGVTGIKGETRPTISVTWNVTDWDVS
jgi:peptide/nickel transport system substrate-binding protein